LHVPLPHMMIGNPRDDGGREGGWGRGVFEHSSKIMFTHILIIPFVQVFLVLLYSAVKRIRYHNILSTTNKSTVSSNSYATLTLVTFLSLEVMPNTSANQLYLLYR
jgi:hypothetical protein